MIRLDSGEGQPSSLKVKTKDSPGGSPSRVDVSEISTSALLIETI